MECGAKKKSGQGQVISGSQVTAGQTEPRYNRRWAYGYRSRYYDHYDYEPYYWGRRRHRYYGSNYDRHDYRSFDRDVSDRGEIDDDTGADFLDS